MSEKLSKGKGWRPDLPDARDHVLELALAHWPATVRLDETANMPLIADQGQLGSCTAFGSLRCFDFAQHVETGNFMNGSHLFQYYNTRSLEGTEGSDAGGTIRDAMKALAKYGVCPETEWPYVIHRYKREPLPKCYNDAMAHESVEYLRVSRKQIPKAIAAGFPVVFGCVLYESFESPGPRKGNKFVMPIPNPHTEAALGGHCMVVVGYDAPRNLFRVANSWGTDWGDKGYFWMPYEYLLNTGYASDFWTLKKVKA